MSVSKIRKEFFGKHWGGPSIAIARHDYVTLRFSFVKYLTTNELGHPDFSFGYRGLNTDTPTPWWVARGSNSPLK